MKFELNSKGGRKLIATEEGEKLKCFKCGKGRFDYIPTGNYMKAVDNNLLWYWCEQRFKSHQEHAKSFVFCKRKECYERICSKTGHETEHNDWCIDTFEGFEE